MNFQEVAIGSLIPDPANARKHADKNLKAIKGSLARFGQQKPIVVGKNNIVIAGNGTLEAAKSLGWETIKIVRTDLEGTEATAFAIADNRSGELAEWDAGVLADTLRSLDDIDFDLDSIGFDENDLEKLMPTEAEGMQGQTDPDAVPENVDTRCKPGDLWELGRHRLLCGDSTNLVQIEELMDGELADMVWTDPPYNVNYEGKTKDALKIKNDAMNDSDFRQFLRDVYTGMYQVTKPGGAIYVAHADSEGYNFRGAMVEAGWLLKQCLIWVKSAFVMGRQDYHWRHEPILYGWRDGAAHSWEGDRKQSTVLEFDRPNRNGEHPTMKPVELVAYCIKNSSKQGERVLDLFGGSGTTLIAAEKLGRAAYLMELDPKYCDVILKRWEDFTGKRAVRIE